MSTDRPALGPGGTLHMPSDEPVHARTRLTRVVASELRGELRNDEFAHDIAGQVVAALAGCPDLLRALADEQQSSGLAPGEAIELTETERLALPAVNHRPVFEGLGRPNAWICGVCWGDGWVTKWPCEPATRGGVELAAVLGLEAHR
jgi:hypothetical protein